MAPMVHGLEAKYSGQIEFVFLDADAPQTQAFQEQFGFRYQPEFYLVDSTGNLIKKWIGFIKQEEFEASFAELLE